jgi:2-(1,2-epoxy-1,2-dihydrophenyl)acetyl-CoA isomerase
VTSPPVRYQFDVGLARITFDDAARGNPINMGFVEALVDAVECAKSDRARVVILDAEGRFFCVGGDLESVHECADKSAMLGRLVGLLNKAIAELHCLDAIVISAVHGTAAGAGFPLAMAADLVLASDRATFSLGHTKVGLSVDGGASLLVRSLGLHRTLQLTLLNESMSAREAQRAGLLAQVVEGPELANAVDELARRLLNGPSQGQALTKHVVRAASGDSSVDLLREVNAIQEASMSPDTVEGVAAFLAKRPPRFNPAGAERQARRNHRELIEEGTRP